MFATCEGVEIVPSTRPSDPSFQMPVSVAAQTCPPPTTRQQIHGPIRAVATTAPVRGSTFVSTPRSLDPTQTAPSPNATSRASGTEPADSTRPLAGSTRTIRDIPSATQTDPAPIATPPPRPGLDRP